MGMKMRYEAEGLLFVNKKKQKNFDSFRSWALAATTPRTQIIKSFLLLFFKKAVLAFFP